MFRRRKKAREKDFQLIRRALINEQIEIDEGAARLFSLGYSFERAGFQELADHYYQRTIDLLEFLCLRGSSEDVLLSVARSALRHGIALINLDRIEPARAAFRRAVELFDCVVARGVSAPAVDELARSISWLASSQSLARDYRTAENTYRRACAVWRQLVRYAPTAQKQTEYKRFLRLSLVGLRECEKCLEAESARFQ